MWKVSILSDPLVPRHHPTQTSHQTTHVVNSTISLKELLATEQALALFREGGHAARVALSDFVARKFIREKTNCEIDQSFISLEPLDRVFLKSKRRKQNLSAPYPPYVLERNDFWCSDDELIISVRSLTESRTAGSASNNGTSIHSDEKKTEKNSLEFAVKTILQKLLPVGDSDFAVKLMQHIACVVLQHRIREKLALTKAVAFIADRSILPRKSGTSDTPMTSPPAVPFKAPPESPMSQTVTIDMGMFSQSLPSNLVTEGSTSVSLPGLVIPAGITLICGGGYHGKSTMLRTIALGIYNKIPGDGREFCVAVPDAVSVRAEDGRYVNNCNISAFISNLPTPPGVKKAMDTQHFSSRDSSGSTSQAANVVEAIEMGASALLIDEDVSAANFMARDGRMRALVMDESITPLLYRVNGLFNSHGISSVVVVGGVGDWLDVPHQVLLLDKYVASDATKKAQSISYQFSYGHVQYAGRGVVHRLEWDRKGTPIPRRPVDSFSSRFSVETVISLLDGGHAISLHEHESSNDGSDDGMVIDRDDDDGCIEASRLEQLMGRKQLYGCGLCILWLLQAAQRNTSRGMPDLLSDLDEVLDQGGIAQALNDIGNGTFPSTTWEHLVEAVGFVERPRRFEIGQALTRLQGIQMEEIPVEDDGAEAAARAEEERKRKVLADLWEARRKK